MVRHAWLGAAFFLFASAPADAIDDFVRKSMATDQIPGVGVAIIPPGGKPQFRAYGYANLETRSRMSPDSVFRIASISKNFCAYAILFLEAQSRLNREDSIRRWIPEAPPEWEPITLAQLLAHRSGLPNPEDAFQFGGEYTVAEFVAFVGQQPLRAVPGTTYQYNNFGYSLLGVVAERASGLPLDDLVSQVMFTPLGMSRTRYYTQEEVIPDRVDAYRWERNQWERAYPLRPRIFAGSGGILSSLRDLARYEAELRRPRFLDPQILGLQRTPYGGAATGYGAGWHRVKLGSVDAQLHTGTTHYFTSAFVRDLDNRWTVIVFRNSLNGSARAWAERILQLARDGR